MILSTIAEHGEILTTKICEITGLAQNTAAQILRAAASDGLIVRVRTTKIVDSGGKRFGVLEYRNCATSALVEHIAANSIKRAVSGPRLAIHNDVMTQDVRDRTALIRKILPTTAVAVMGGAV